MSMPSDLMSALASGGGGSAEPPHPHRKKPEPVKPTPQTVMDQAITTAISAATAAPASTTGAAATTPALTPDQQAYLDDAKQAITDWNQRQKTAYQANVVKRNSGVTISGVTTPVSLYNALRYGETAAATAVKNETQTHFVQYTNELTQSKSVLLTSLAGSRLSADEQRAVETRLNQMYQDTETAFTTCETTRLHNAKALFDQSKDFLRAKDHYDQRSRFAANSNFVTKTPNPVTRINDQEDFTSDLKLPLGLTKAYVDVYRYEDAKFFRSVRVRAHLSDDPPQGKAAFKIHFADNTSKSVRLEGKENVTGQFELKGDKLARNVLGVDRPEALQDAGMVKSALIKGYVGFIDLFKGKGDATIRSDDGIIKAMVRSAQAVAAEAFAAGNPMTGFDINAAIGSMDMASQEHLVREMYKAFGPNIKLGALVDELPRFQALKPRHYQPSQPLTPAVLADVDKMAKDTLYIDSDNGEYAVRSLDGSKVHRDTLSPALTTPLQAGTDPDSILDNILTETTAKGYTLPAPPAPTLPADAFELQTGPKSGPSPTI